LGLPQLGLGLTQLRSQNVDIHTGQHLSCADQVAFTGQDFPDPSWRLGGDIDFHCLNTPVAAGQA